MNLLLQILEEGQITDSFGRRVDFRNTIIIITSNGRSKLGKRSERCWLRCLGDFGKRLRHMREKIEEEAKKAYKPEFLNRLDKQIIFRMLEETTCARS